MKYRIPAKVVPNSSQEAVTRQKDLFEQESLKIWVHASPENGKANLAAIKLVSKFLNVRHSNISIVSGLTSRNKILEIEDETI